MKGFCLEVSGPYACFTRPEMKVERVSYDVITPSAARAIFDSILWKPAISWSIKRIEVLSPIKWISVRRNEVGTIASPRKACIYVEEDRQQRAGLFLRDVKYRLYAEFNFIPKEKRPKTQNPLPGQLVSAEDTADLRKDDSPAKYAAMFERRAKKGQCFNQPYLGCREFDAQFYLVDPQKEQSAPISETSEFGWMLYDMDYSDPSTPKPLFFNAKMQNGVINVPARENKEEVRG
ncbi:MAG: type I-C CRISPR-associated protein Cas5c [Elusimicrobiales bacterium]|jgi:CRISPR-associated protein Cas5d